jgi:hypothetical protein
MTQAKQIIKLKGRVKLQGLLGFVLALLFLLWLFYPGFF